MEVIQSTLQNDLSNQEQIKLVVAFTKEGIDQRKQGIKTQIMVFYPQIKSTPELIFADLEPYIYSGELMESFKLHLKIMKIKPLLFILKSTLELIWFGFQ